MQKNPFESYSRKRYLSHIVSRARFIIPIIFLILYFINSYFFSFITIKDDAMLPALIPGKTYLIKKYPITLNKLHALFSNTASKTGFQRFDIVAIETHHPSLFAKILNPFVNIITLGFFQTNPSQIVLRRVIALPGDNIEIKSKQIFINEKKLNPSWNIQFEDPSIFSTLISRRDYYPNTFITDKKVFTLNDRWDAFSDSRNSSPESTENILGIISEK